MLVALPFGLPHAEQVCAMETDLTMAQVRKLGFSENLIGAIQQAHRKFAVSKKH
jgi:hypothetical protein